MSQHSAVKIENKKVLHFSFMSHKSSEYPEFFDHKKKSFTVHLYLNFVSLPIFLRMIRPGSKETLKIMNIFIAFNPNLKTHKKNPGIRAVKTLPPHWMNGARACTPQRELVRSSCHVPLIACRWRSERARARERLSLQRERERDGEREKERYETFVYWMFVR